MKAVTASLKTLDAIIYSNNRVKEYYEKYKIVPLTKNLPNPEEIVSGDEDDLDIDKIEEVPEFKKLKGMVGILKKRIKR